MAELRHYKRYSSKIVKEALLDTPMVFIMGARQSGKTTLVKSLTNTSWKFINLDDQTQLNLIKEDPLGFIRALTHDHIIVDEIQRLDVGALLETFTINALQKQAAWLDQDIAFYHYDGEQTLPFGENLFAVPIYALWN